MNKPPTYIVRSVDGPDSEGDNYEIIHRERSFRDVVVARGVLEKPTAQLFAASPTMIATLLKTEQRIARDPSDIRRFGTLLAEIRAAIELAKVKP